MAYGVDVGASRFTQKAKSVDPTGAIRSIVGSSKALPTPPWSMTQVLASVGVSSGLPKNFRASSTLENINAGSPACPTGELLASSWTETTVARECRLPPWLVPLTRFRTLVAARLKAIRKTPPDAKSQVHSSTTAACPSSSAMAFNEVADWARIIGSSLGRSVQQVRPNASLQWTCNSAPLLTPPFHSGLSRAALSHANELER